MAEQMDDYVVRLVMRVEANSPEHAVLTFIGHMVDNGLTNWIYRVEDPETHEPVGYFDGHGVEVNIDEEAAAAVREEEAASEEAVQTPVQTESDEELHTLAESLNQGEQPATQP